MPLFDPVSIARIGASYGALSVVLGAFGSHGLQRAVSDPKLIKNWEIASHWLMFHSLALLAVSAHPRLSQKRIGAGAIAVGTALFSGSLYGMVWLKSRGVQAGKYLGPVTPLGGLIMLAGWTALIF